MSLVQGASGVGQCYSVVTIVHGTCHLASSGIHLAPIASQLDYLWRSFTIPLTLLSASYCADKSAPASVSAAAAVAVGRSDTRVGRRLEEKVPRPLTLERTAAREARRTGEASAQAAPSLLGALCSCFLH